MNEYIDYKKLKVKLSLDLYDKYGYVCKIKDPFEFRYVVNPKHHTSVDEIESLVNVISNKIKDYLLSELNE